MDLGYDLAAVLPEMRRQAESRMTDLVTVNANTETVDEVTLETITAGDELYSGVARVASQDGAVSDREAAGQQFSTQAFTLHLPADTAGLRLAGAVVTVTASAGNPAIVGAQFRVTGNAGGSQTTAARFPLERIN